MGCFTFKWPAGPTNVRVTGSFNDWTEQLEMNKGALDGGVFSLTTAVPDNEELQFKFIVDDEWCVSDEFEKTSDEHGNTNNHATALQVQEATNLATVLSTPGIVLGGSGSDQQAEYSESPICGDDINGNGGESKAVDQNHNHNHNQIQILDVKNVQDDMHPQQQEKEDEKREEEVEETETEQGTVGSRYQEVQHGENAHAAGYHADNSSANPNVSNFIKVKEENKEEENGGIFEDGAPLCPPKNTQAEPAYETETEFVATSNTTPSAIAPEHTTVVAVGSEHKLESEQLVQNCENEIGAADKLNVAAFPHHRDHDKELGSERNKENEQEGHMQEQTPGDAQEKAANQQLKTAAGGGGDNVSTTTTTASDVEYSSAQSFQSAERNADGASTGTPASSLAATAAASTITQNRVSSVGSTSASSNARAAHGKHGHKRSGSIISKMKGWFK